MYLTITILVDGCVAVTEMRAAGKEKGARERRPEVGWQARLAAAGGIADRVDPVVGRVAGRVGGVFEMLGDIFGGLPGIVGLIRGRAVAVAGGKREQAGRCEQ